MAALDRTALLAALAAIDSEDDAKAAAAGRKAATMVADAGLAWQDVVAEDIESRASDAVGDSGGTVNTAEAVAEAQTKEDALVLIEQLLARDNLYEGTREELMAYKDDIAADEFDDGDLAYLNALYARVMLNAVKKDD